MPCTVLLPRLVVYKALPQARQSNHARLCHRIAHSQANPAAPAAKERTPPMRPMRARRTRSGTGARTGAGPRQPGRSRASCSLSTGLACVTAVSDGQKGGGMTPGLSADESQACDPVHPCSLCEGAVDVSLVSELACRCPTSLDARPRSRCTSLPPPTPDKGPEPDTTTPCAAEPLSGAGNSERTVPAVATSEDPLASEDPLECPPW